MYIGGAGVASSSNSFAFNSNVATTAHNFQNNIFWNARSNASGTGKNYAIAVAGTAPNPAGLTASNNDLFASGTGGFTGLFNAVDRITLTDWQTATGQDANSIAADANFIAPNGTAASVDLHIQPPTACQLGSIAIASVVNDFDNNSRPPGKGDIGADHITPPTASPGMISGQIKTADGAPWPAQPLVHRRCARSDH